LSVATGCLSVGARCSHKQTKRLRDWLHGYNAEPNVGAGRFALHPVGRVPCASTRRRPHKRRRLCRTHCEST
jgi:hypothetical protein